MGEVTRICRMCGNQFDFTEGEQAFYLERGYQPPEYCPECRDARRAARTERELHGESATRVSYPATCSVCGNETSVPFSPDPSRPVYCESCFAERRKLPSR